MSINHKFKENISKPWIELNVFGLGLGHLPRQLRVTGENEHYLRGENDTVLLKLNTLPL